MSKSKKIPYGFTLIEVLISFMILAMGFTIMLGLHLASIKVEYKNQKLNKAMETANEILEQKRLQGGTVAGYSNIDDKIDNCTPFDSCILSVEKETSWRKRLELTVNWKEKLRKLDGSHSFDNKSITVTTYIIKP